MDLNGSCAGCDDAASARADHSAQSPRFDWQDPLLLEEELTEEERKKLEGVIGPR